MSKPDIETFIEEANLHHPTIKFTAEISDTETVFLDTIIYKGTRFDEKSILDVKTHFKKTETFQYTHFTSCHPPSVKKGFVKGESFRILRTNSSETTFEDNISNFKKRLIDRGYPQTLVENLLSENQPLLRQIFKEPPIISYKKGKSLKDMLVRAKLYKVYTRFHAGRDVRPVNPCILSLGTQLIDKSVQLIEYLGHN